jgi:nitroreductase
MKDAIRKRHSVRSYLNKPLTKEDKAIVTNILKRIENQKGPFGHTVDFFFVDNGSDKQTKIGTYGFIKNPPSFIGGVVKNSFYGLIDFGFLMEQTILELTNHNLGTVWLGGTYNRSDFNVNVNTDEIIAAVTPVGYATSKSIRERIIRRVSKGDKRKPFDELFFSVDDSNPIDETHPFYAYLKAIQLAPSASNKQPWRIVIDGTTFHFYLARTPNYGKVLKFDIQVIDIGIALSHLYLTLKEDGHSVAFNQLNPKLDLNYEYMISLKIKA